MEYFGLVGSTIGVTEGRWQDVLEVACGIFNGEDLDQFTPVVLGRSTVWSPRRSPGSTGTTLWRAEHEWLGASISLATFRELRPNRL